ncbi:expansin [Marchantia polymorpha subsp. ruderalis]|uniref:Expansin n=2 Tax=Marchantia polymorpha TaxID=3197 RepID=A0A176WIT3_MARPO|nr:hypothetical protein AXG93_862s1100 [Marchantia polymorpha subsp. ruderalis]PTQ33849.1 hypothetical protein MARPO_0085s0061 [Marchantia polymorpha]BBN05026.1 hypothetical protein Mp_3g09650 [Marchantia polymorpha subsp. ruderalis]|eukprot:PTQ33849.1 hypothetical protein MARPO_0085s0061 [Marchantia polymorpha]
MDSIRIMMARDLLKFKFLVLLICASASINAAPVYTNTKWTDSHATFYGGNNAQGTMGGACGYGNMYSRGYGLETTALSSTLFNKGLTCGACFEIKCKVADTRWCYANAGSIKVTATNLCPANPARPTNNGGWCNPPRTHFDLSYPMFTRLAKAVGGIIPVQFRRVPCVKVGGIRFVMNGNPWFNLVLVYNVAGAGNVVNMQMKGSKTNWFTMKQNWGQNWELKQKLKGQSISFRVTLGNGKVMIANNVAPANWNFQQTFESDNNF